MSAGRAREHLKMIVEMKTFAWAKYVLLTPGLRLKCSTAAAKGNKMTYHIVYGQLFITVSVRALVAEIILPVLKTMAEIMMAGSRSKGIEIHGRTGGIKLMMKERVNQSYDLCRLCAAKETFCDVDTWSLHKQATSRLGEYY